MKTTKLSLFFALLLCVFISSCSTVSYLGDTYPLHQNVDVFYASRDVKREYKVIGHLVNAISINEQSTKNEIIGKAKTVGADGIIFTGFGTTAGKDGSNTITADAIKYTDNGKPGITN